jgi:hypothetical protein
VVPNETIGVTVSGIVVCPVNDWRMLPGIVDHLAADLDTIAGCYRHRRSEIDIVYDLNGSAGRLRPELFVLGMGVRAHEKRRAARYRRHHVDHFPVLLCAWITRARENV